MASTVSLVILAGGQGQRLGGQNKALKQWQGQPILSHILQQACSEQLFEQIVVVANQDLSAIEQCIQKSPCGKRIRLVSDSQPGYLGPLMGIVSGLKAVESKRFNQCFPWVQLWPVDAPGSVKKVFQFLQARTIQSSAPESSLLLPDDGQRAQPLFAQLSTALLPELEQAIELGTFSVNAVFQALPHQRVLAEALADQFINLNTPQQWLERSQNVSSVVL